jgi:phosphatidylglycerophosphatase A
VVKFALATATALGVGYVPFASGTFGSLAGLALWWALPASPVVQLIAALGLFVLGAWSAHVAERHFNNTDPGPVVIDEVMGMVITLIWSPRTWPAAVAGFLLFRLFDIVKPYPANRLERLHGGLGVMADDAMAAIYANIALQGVLRGGYSLFGWPLP